MKKKLMAAMLSAVTAVSMIASYVDNGILAFGKTASETSVTETMYTEDMGDISSMELYEAYVEQKLYDTGGISMFSVYDRTADMNEVEEYIYSQLKEQVTAIADGSVSSTEITIPLPDDLMDILSVVNDTEETGESWVSDGKISAEAKNELVQVLNDTVDLSGIINILLDSCPYEMYWMKKGVPYTLSYGISFYGYGSQESLSITKINYKFPVADDFSGGEYIVNTNTDRIDTVKANAQAIIDRYANVSDYEKLVAYRNEICDLVEYEDNYENISYGNVWQLLNVFDGDTTTNVVCEGYSKAFQYLCDKTVFNDDICCYTVSGDMDEGPHMWNIVRMENGKNYLVDVTNCDSGAVGFPDYLFLTTGQINGYYQGVYPAYTVDANNYSINYDYDSDTMSTYSVDDLTLAESRYDVTAEYMTEILQQPQNVTASANDTAVFTTEVKGKGLKYTWYYKLPSSRTYKKYSDNMTNVFKMNTSKSKNGTKVYCVVTDSAGKTVKTDTVTLTVS